MEFTHMKVRAFAVTVLLLVAMHITAQDGSPAYNFLNIATSTRSYGLGGVNITTVDDDINTIDQNPSLLGPEFGMQIGVNYMRYIGDANFTGVKVGGRASDRSGWAATVQYYGYGEIKETDQNGMSVGSFSPKDLSFGGVYSHEITDRLRGGIALKMVYSSYHEYSALALTTDLGMNYYDADRDLSLSLVVTNLGGQVKRFTDKYDRLPVDVRVGWAKSFGTLPIRFGVTAWNLTKWDLPYYDAGDGSAESDMHIRRSFMSNLFRHLIFSADFIPGEKFHIGLGYNYKTRTDMSTYSRSFLSGFSACAGLKVKGFDIGVAFAQPHSGATTFMVNLAANIHDFIK